MEWSSGKGGENAGKLEHAISIYGRKANPINSVLDSIPTYIMSLIPMPYEVKEQLVGLRRAFLWEGNREEHKFHLVKWDKVILPKEQRGLGIRDLRKHNNNIKGRNYVTR